SGNTGIAYAQICASLQIGVTIVLPENASPERKEILTALGVELVYTSKFGTTDEAQHKALEMAEGNPDLYFYADQYANPSNWQAHQQTTAMEIVQQTRGAVTHFITGLGTTGTYIGTTIGLKSHDEKVQCIGLQPETALHGLEGWKHLETAKVPKIYKEDIGDGKRIVSTQDAYELIRHVARTQGLLLSPSSAANVAGAIQLAEELDEGYIVTMFPDDAQKYMDVITQVINA
ncbi:MAG: pyridoxal-phosphate dependent enzyme, partial [Saprospiraceae bacterium]|nr:pyridoxal-phosphate dependent enzyme [Saprospiraceae bacterium]